MRRWSRSRSLEKSFDAIVATMQLGNVGYENKTNELGDRLIWLDHAVVARLKPCADRRELQRCHFAVGEGDATLYET